MDLARLQQEDGLDLGVDLEVGLLQSSMMMLKVIVVVVVVVVVMSILSRPGS